MRAPLKRPWVPNPRRNREPRTSVIPISILAALLVIAPVSASESESETERWVPSFSLYFDVLGQAVEGSVDTSPVLGSPISDGGCLETTTLPFPPFVIVQRLGRTCPLAANFDNSLVSPSQEGDDTNVVPMVGATLELMSPALLEDWLRPRLFAHADLSAAFGFERNVAGTGKPGDMLIPELPPTASATDERVVSGQGSRAKQQTKRWVISGGAGLAFTTELFQRTVRIKPSFEFIREELELIGAVHRAVQLVSPAGLTLNDYRQVKLTARQDETLYGLGPGLEIEVDTVKSGPFMISMYAAGRGYRFLGNLHTTLIAMNEAGETATFRFENEPWAWRGGVGFRFRFIGD